MMESTAEIERNSSPASIYHNYGSIVLRPRDSAEKQKGRLRFIEWREIITSF